jgi:hypothetical protein
MAEDARHGIRHDAAGGLHPGDLVAVALDRRPPIRRDLQLRQRALDREHTAIRLNLENVRRDPAGERLDARLLSADEAQPAQGPDEIVIVRHA